MRLTVSPSTVQISPGEHTVLSITARNTTAIIDRYHFSVEDIPAEWYSLSTTNVSLFPAAEEILTLSLHPPTGVTTSAGIYPVTVRATSEDDPTQITSAMFSITVTTVGKMSLEVSPLMAQGRHATYRATFMNGSNTPQTMVIEAHDAEEALLFRMRPDDAVEVPAGGQATVEVRVRPERRHLIGDPHSYSFELRGMLEEQQGLAPPDPTLTRQARFTYVPRIRALMVPMWLWNSTRLIAAVLAAVVVLGMSYLGINRIVSSNRTPPVNTAQQVAQLLLTVNAPNAQSGQSLAP
ncbi:MAG TPA: hypothetical protein VN837_08945, partial [Chloroflexota bacterium]|nr:hypothetical protein [Chloroflexota bacterium]